MTSLYMLAPNARWQGRDLTGQPAINGYVKTFQNLTRIPKATYSDPSGTNINPNPTPLDGKGEANIYWQDGELYTMQLFTSDGRLVYTQDNYPTTDSNGGGAITVFSNIDNIVRNPQFTFWTNTTDFPNIGLGSQNLDDYICDDWYFQNNDATAIIEISRQTFGLGQVTVPGSPVYYLNYACTVAGTTQNSNQLMQPYASVQTFSGLPVFVSIWLSGDTGKQVEVNLVQFFGSGGSPSAQVTTPFITATLTDTLTQYTGIVVLPSVSGKTVGTNGDDSLQVKVVFPFNDTANINVSTVQIQQSDAALNYPYRSQDEEFKRLNKDISQSVFTTGDFKMSLNPNAPTGWASCNDGTIGNLLSGSNTIGLRTKALFELIWNTCNNTLCPIFNSDGSTGARGANAEADYNANKRLSLAKALGRVLAQQNPGASPTAEPIGFTQGSETYAFIAANNAPHSHGVTLPGGASAFIYTQGTTGNGLTNLGGTIGANGNFTIDPQGSGTPFDIIQPTLYVNVLLKL